MLCVAPAACATVSRTLSCEESAALSDSESVSGSDSLGHTSGSDTPTGCRAGSPDADACGLSPRRGWAHDPYAPGSPPAQLITAFAASPPAAVMPAAHGMAARRAQERERVRTADGRTIVTTPWFPDGVVKEAVTLSSEVHALAALLAPTPPERRRAAALRAALHDAACELWPNAVAKWYGATAAGARLGDADADIVCENCGDHAHDGVPEIAARLAAFGYQAEPLPGPAHIARLRIHGRGASAQCSLVAGRCSARRRGGGEAPEAVRQIATVVQLVVRQSGCSDMSKGGLSSRCCVEMVLRAAQHCMNPTDAGQLLVDFFELYSPGGALDVATLFSGGAADALSRAVLADPACTGAVHPQRLRTVFSNCADVLRKWSNAQWDGYRGRTPLSSILAFRALWARCDAQHES